MIPGGELPGLPVTSGAQIPQGYEAIRHKAEIRDPRTLQVVALGTIQLYANRRSFYKLWVPEAGSLWWPGDLVTIGELDTKAQQWADNRALAIRSWQP